MPDEIPLESLFQLMYAVRATLSDDLAKEDVGVAPMQVKVLKMIKARRQCTAQDIAETFRRDKAQIARLIQNLISQNLINRAPNPADKRSQLLELNDNALRILRQTKRIESGLMDKMFTDVSASEQALFVSLAKRLRSNLEADRKTRG